MVKRKVLARAGLVLFGCLMLAAVEAALRLLWSPAMLADLEGGAIDPFRMTGEMMETDDAFKGALRFSRFPGRKDSATYRVFVLGGSFAFGYPFASDLSWPSLLEKRLHALYRDRDFEVINLGGTSYGSTRALGLFRGILQYEPDLVILCSGHNEFAEDSYTTSIDPSGAFERSLRRLYLYQALKRLIPLPETRPKLVDIESVDDAGAYFLPVIDGTVFYPTDDRRRKILARYEANLKAIASLARKEDIPLFLCTMPSNITDWAPGEDRNGPGDRSIKGKWIDLVKRGRGKEREGNMAAALDLYREADVLWDRDPLLSFFLGRLLLSAGRKEEGRRYLVRARDLDTVPIRAPSAINDAVRSVSRAYGTPVVDLEQIFADHPSWGIAGQELIFDHVHPSPRGNAVVAKAVWTGLRERGAPWSEYDLGAEEEYEKVEIAAVEGPLDLKADLAFMWGKIFVNKGMLEQALSMFRVAVSKGYDGPYALFEIAKIRYQRGELKACLKLLKRLYGEYPRFFEMYPLLAAVHHALGNRRPAIRFYRLALDNDVTDRAVYHSLATLLLEEGNLEQSAGILERALRLYPDDCDLLSLQGRVVEAGADGPDSLRYYRDHLARLPSCPLLWENLGLFQMGKKRWDEAEATFREALRHDPSFAFHYLNLGYVYYDGLKNTGAARKAFQKYLDIQSEGIDRIPEDMRWYFITRKEVETGN